MLFAYFVSMPAALHFLANVDSKNLKALITVNEYLNFVAAYLGGFALLFQLPLIMLFINRIKPQKPSTLMGKQRWVILFSFIIAAILTPTPDPFNQFIMAAPVILLYQFSVILIWFINRKKTTTSTAIAETEPVVAEPQTIPAQVINLKPDVSRVVKNRQPQLIMDVFWVPHNPGL